MQITVSISPPIPFKFDKELLSKPTAKFYDDSETLYRIFNYIQVKLKKKVDDHPSTMKKYEELEKQFKELYERAKAKETEYQKKNGESFQKPFDYFTYTGRNYRKVFEKIRYRSCTRHISAKFWGYNDL